MNDCPVCLGPLVSGACVRCGWGVKEVPVRRRKKNKPKPSTKPTPAQPEERKYWWYGD